jgi:hypothetical protein
MRQALFFDSYRNAEDGIEITRVLQAAQDWWSLLDVDEDRP